jgi:predicted  nucleic acid-binding Zn-ribbon protein
LQNAKQTSIDANTDIDKLRNELQNAKQTSIDANTDIDKLRKELYDLRAIVENLVKDTKESSKNVQKEDLSKKVELPKKPDLSKKTDSPSKKEVNVP